MLLDISIYVISFIVFLFIPPLLDGLERKIRARLHSRVGPPTIFQTWYDIRKLLAKEQVATDTFVNTFFIVSILFTTSMLTIPLMPFGSIGIFSNSRNSLILFIILLASSQLLWVALSLSPGNPFSTIGVYREALLEMVNELFLILTGFGLMVYIGGTSFRDLTNINYSAIYILFIVLLIVISYVSSGRVPFDLAEAEPELASGVLIEFSGPILGIVLYTNFLKRAILCGFIANLILLPLKSLVNDIVLAALFYLLLFFIWLIYAIVSILLARSRIDLAPRTMFVVYLLFYSIIVVLWLIGI
ncbi:hydrogenase-4 component C [Staphylothermus marinus F1]|uniref:Hydrogenase-4 component C n=1 Tax=Staphylothermus marinus (strain ATCC 43588 / DSM 3639 / JCM 9404 / F1) TaxID=399550 RepID=A3DNE8_STAMF|nr:complex I subunit 1 family protein [Staphylothermus marinus]ABN70158.1 hydrogenase-4 component C [Staphylothermus marinus F1]